MKISSYDSSKINYYQNTAKITIIKLLSDCHDISGDMRRYKASYNSMYIAADGHELLLKNFGQILLRVPHDMSTIRGVIEKFVSFPDKEKKYGL